MCDCATWVADRVKRCLETACTWPSCSAKSIPESCLAALRISSVGSLEPKLNAARRSLAATSVSADLAVCAFSPAASPIVALGTLAPEPAQHATMFSENSRRQSLVKLSCRDRVHTGRCAVGQLAIVIAWLWTRGSQAICRFTLRAGACNHSVGQAAGAAILSSTKQ